MWGTKLARSIALAAMGLSSATAFATPCAEQWSAVLSSLPAHPMSMQALDCIVAESMTQGAVDRCAALLAVARDRGETALSLYAMDAWLDHCGATATEAELRALVAEHADAPVGIRLVERLAALQATTMGAALADLPPDSRTGTFAAGLAVLAGYEASLYPEALSRWLELQSGLKPNDSDTPVAPVTLSLLADLLGANGLPVFEAYARRLPVANVSGTAFTQSGLHDLLQPLKNDALRAVYADATAVRGAVADAGIPNSDRLFLALQQLGYGVSLGDGGGFVDALDALDNQLTDATQDRTRRLHAVAAARAFLHDAYRRLPGDAFGEQVRAAADEYTGLLIRMARDMALATTPGLRAWLEATAYQLQQEHRYLAEFEGLGLLLEAFPEDPARTTWRTRLGKIASGAWRDHATEAALLRATWTRETDTDLRDAGMLEEARALYHGDLIKEARVLLQRRAISAPDPAIRDEAQVLEILCEFRLGDVERAKVKIDDFLQRRWGSTWGPYVNLLRAYLLMLWGDYAEALRTCERMQGMSLDATQQRKLREMLQDLAPLVARDTAAASAQPAQAMPNVVMISLDTVRPDRLGCYGNANAHTPNLDRIAAMGTVFTQAYSTSSWTKPSHASVFTGRYPMSHGAQGHSDMVAPRATLLPETLQDLGYRTLATISAPPLNSLYGFDRGFDAYDDYTYELDRMANQFLRGNSGPVKIHSGATSSLIMHAAMLSYNRLATPDRPVFYFVNYFDAHHNYLPVAPFNAASRAQYYGDTWGVVDGWVQGAQPLDRTKYRVDRARLLSLYDDEIAAIDREVGTWLYRAEVTQQLENTYFIVFADHGEEFLEHGSLTHGHGLFEEVLHVPLILCGPGVPKGATLDTPVSLVDIAPTLLDLLGRPAPEDVDGVSLTPLLRGEALAERPLYASLNLDAFEGYAVRVGDEKLITNTRDNISLLFDLGTDPDEQRDLATERPDRVLALRDLAVRHADAQRQKGLALDAGAQVTPESLPTLDALLDQLRSMGYVGN